MRRRKQIRDIADENSSLLFEPVSSTINQYDPSIIPHVLEIVIIKNPSFPVYLTSCSALRSDYIIDTYVAHFTTHRIALT